MPRVTSCGVVVTDGTSILLGHATHSPRWDIPKGIAEPGEEFRTAAARELEEETGLIVPPDALRDLGVHRYMSGKDLALFTWTPEAMPRPESLVCRSMFSLPGGAMAPEFDKFALLHWNAALARLGKNMARILGELHASLTAPSPSEKPRM
ncbi:MAG TPA: NUDIX domain-containing protein [Acetobacteraceae bacterium]|nr:NUDIX domain-containing protein [Acetobacteraceae bacterium]